MVVPFVDGETLTAEKLNVAFGVVTPPVAELLAGDGTTFDVIEVGTGLVLNSGTLAAPGGSGTVTEIDTAAPLNGGPITGSGTVGMAAIGSGLVIGNAGAGSAVPAAATVTALLDRALGSTQGDVLYRSGASWTVLAPGTAGQALTSGGGAANPAWHTPDWNGGTVTALGAGLSLTSGTLAATAAGTVTEVDTGAGLTGGPVTTAGTISFAAIADQRILANLSGGSATPVAIAFAGMHDAADVLTADWNAGSVGAIGSGLTITAGTIAATAGGGGTVTQIVAGSGLNGGTITTAGTITANWNGGTVTNLGNGLAINSGTIAAQNQGTLTLSGTTTGTVTPAGLTSAIVNVGTAAGTIAVGNGFAGQALRLEIVQGATAHTVAFDASVHFGADITSFTASVGAGQVDYVQLVFRGTAWDLLAVNHGF